MKRILVFGTGGSAEKVATAGGDIYEIVAYLDNNPAKHGTLFHDRPVHAPSDLPALDYEEIMIASMWHDEIRSQLIDQHGIPPERIRRMPKAFVSQGKRYHPFEDPGTRRYAGQVLRYICDVLEAHRIPCFIDHGTLLGLVRDDCIMSWDDDLDLSVAWEKRFEFYACVPELLRHMPDANQMEWRAEIVFNSIDEDIALFLFVDDPSGQRNAFNAGISFFRKQNGLAVEAINWAPDHHYREGEWIDTSLGSFRAPDRYRDYLALHYGAWETPRVDMAFSEIDNFKSPEAMAHWLPWDACGGENAQGVLETARKGPVHGVRLYVPLTWQGGSGQMIMNDPTTLDLSLSALREILYVRVSVVLGVDEARAVDDLAPMIARLRKAEVAKEIVLEWPQGRMVPAEVAEIAEDMGVRVCPPVIPRRRITLDHPPGTSTVTMGAVKHFRCPQKRSLMLWNQWIARCPRALTLALEGRPNADLINLDVDQTLVKQRILDMLRQRPCADHAGCPAHPCVWAPFQHAGDLLVSGASCKTPRVARLRRSPRWVL